MNKFVEAVKPIVRKSKGSALVEYALLLMLFVCIASILLAFSIHNKELYARVACELNRAQAINSTTGTNLVACPSGGVITFTDGKLYCSIHSSPTDNQSEVPYLWNTVQIG
ncbi:hypothetical protein [Youngiibacter fragilis]|uniref:Uncharacterized protein n=1 Tax=Youngiibacter fragilis 232.1 TaxID=994573 RepID=V7IB00_9CLOT|nr:hypothetical protein [Youngiibacter fragilis]ETA82486.1 hypothetical protein T472_0200940 [Youngiibacter fragilis 232.1]